MNFLADKNLEASVMEVLRRAGHDVATVHAQAGIRDREVLARSVGEHRILITNDKDFAELSFLQRSASVGIEPLKGKRENPERRKATPEGASESSEGSGSTVQKNRPSPE